VKINLVNNAFILLTIVLLSSCAKLAGNYQLSAPDVKAHSVKVVSLDKDRYYMQADGEKFSGTYRLEKEILILEKPDLPRLTEYKWLWDGKKILTLIAEPAFPTAGQRYLPATLTKP